MWRYSLFFLHPRATRKKSKQIVCLEQYVGSSRVLPEQGISVSQANIYCRMNGLLNPSRPRGIFWLPKWDSLLEAISYYSSSVLTVKHSLRKQIQSTASRTSVLADTRHLTQSHIPQQRSHIYELAVKIHTRVSQALTNTPAHTRKWWWAASTNSLTQNMFWQSSKQRHCK